MDLPDECLWGHHERESGPSNEASSPSVVRSTQSASNLVKVVSSSHSPLPVVILKNVIAVSKSIWVSRGLSWLESVSTSDVCLEINVLGINRLRCLKSLIVEAWVSSHSSASFSWDWVSSGTKESHGGSSDKLFLSNLQTVF